MIKKQFTYVYFYLSIGLCISCKTSVPYTQNEKLDLVRRYKKDQDIQQYDLKRLGDKKYFDSINKVAEIVFQENTKIIKEYFKNKQFPGIKENGKEVALSFWVIVQHSDHDIVFQQQVLKSMRKKIKSKDVSRRNYAYLYDRVAKNKKQKQLYGTQVVWDTGFPVPYSLKEPEKLNRLRKDMDLEPIEEYLASFLK